MKNLLFFLLFSALCSAQNHVDILKINYGETFKNKFEGISSDTRVKSFEAELTLPFPINDSHAIVSGIDHSNDHLQLYPDQKTTSLYNTTLKLGLASKWNEKWSSSIILLPKLASDYNQLSSKDFYMGIYASFAIKKNENLSYRFGFYTSTEAYGVFATPILGWQYRSPNEHFEMNMSLPINGVLTYRLDKVAVGIDYVGISRSFRIHQENLPAQYADLSSLRFSGFLEKSVLNESILLRAKLGYSTNNYEMYAEGEKIDLGLSAFNFGDNRTQLNPDISGSLFFKVEAIYRFYLPQPKKE